MVNISPTWKGLDLLTTARSPTVERTLPPSMIQQAYTTMMVTSKCVCENLFAGKLLTN